MRTVFKRKVAVLAEAIELVMLDASLEEDAGDYLESLLHLQNILQIEMDKVQDRVSIASVESLNR